jgi:hypothetical protein
VILKQPSQPTRNTSDTSTSNLSKATCEDIDIDLNTYFAKSHRLIPFLEFVKIPSHKNKVRYILGFDEGKEVSIEDTSMILQTMHKGGLNGEHDPFYLFLRVNNLLLHTRALANVIPLIIMHQLGLRITRPYRNI